MSILLNTKGHLINVCMYPMFLTNGVKLREACVKLFEVAVKFASYIANNGTPLVIHFGTNLANIFLTLACLSTNMSL